MCCFLVWIINIYSIMYIISIRYILFPRCHNMKLASQASKETEKLEPYTVHLQHGKEVPGYVS